MAKSEDTTPAEMAAAIVHELRGSILAAMLDAEEAAKTVEGSMVDLTRAITRFRRSQARIARRVDTLGWLPALLHGDPLTIPRPAACRVATALAAVAQPASYLRTEIPRELRVLVAPGVLEIVLSNLFTNARQHAGPDAKITVSAHLLNTKDQLWPCGTPITLAGPAVLLGVADDGPGIPAAFRLRLFQPFQRAHADRPGLGVGLWLSRQLVRAHGGDLWLGEASRGATFLSVWPPAPAEQAPAGHSDGWSTQPDEFGAQLQALRQREGLSLKWLAAQTGLDADTLRKVELGKHWPRSDTRARIMDALSQFRRASRDS